MIKSLNEIIKDMNKNILGVNIFNSENNLPFGKELNDYFIKTNYKKLNDELIQEISQISTQEFLKTIVKTNQYVLIEETFKRNVFNSFLNYFNNVNNTIENKEKINSLSIKHQKELKEILYTIDELKTMDNGQKYFDLIPCSEYSPKKQCDILDLNFNAMEGPILDIGCGSKANLIKFLSLKIDNVYGIDRFIDNPTNNIKEESWLDFDYGINKWGTIISHLSFTNHFKREHLKIESNYIEYAQVYMKILNSLKKGGKFYYVPGLKFIEDLLDKSIYKVDSKKIQGNITRTIILKIK